MPHKSDTFETVRQIFSSYLKNNGHRKTPERFSVLKEVYEHDGHFDIESLWLKMKNNKYRISRATLYNTMELLLACKLVIKRQFGKNVAQFEKAYKFKQHDHLICLDCGKVFEFCDHRIHDIQNSIERTLEFEVSHHALNFYGKCKKRENGYCEHHVEKNSNE